MHYWLLPSIWGYFQCSIASMLQTWLASAVFPGETCLCPTWRCSCRDPLQPPSGHLAISPAFPHSPEPPVLRSCVAVVRVIFNPFFSFSILRGAALPWISVMLPEIEVQAAGQSVGRQGQSLSRFFFSHLSGFTI